MENVEEKKSKLGVLIFNEANRNFPTEFKKGKMRDSRGHFIKMTEEEYFQQKRHHDICVELNRLATTYNFPYACLVYFAVGKEAHKQEAFKKGYTKINSKKAETIIKWLDRFAKHNNPSFRTSDRIVHGLTKFYETYSTKDKDFNFAMKNFERQPTFKASKYKTMAEFYEIFFRPFANVVEIN